MYGLVNQALENLVIKDFGEEKWREIMDASGVDIPYFQSFVSYDDKVTYALVESASKILKKKQETILEDFGYFWVTYTAQKGYGSYFKAGGSTLKEFILNLNRLHENIEEFFPEFHPPLFEFENVSDHGLTLIYKSTRVGLAPMLLGLLKGLGSMFKTNIEISQIPNRGESFDRFDLRF